MSDSVSRCEVDDWALRHVESRWNRGSAGLVGATGSGKSVLASLLSRLYDVERGEIRIDGQDIRELSLPALAKARATARSRTRLCSMSVAENLGWAAPHATDEEMAQAIDGRGAQFVYDLPFGLTPGSGQGMSRPAGSAAAVAGQGDPRRAEDPRARRHPLASMCTPRPSSRRRCGVFCAREERGAEHSVNGNRRREPGVDRSSRGPGRVASGRHHHNVGTHSELLGRCAVPLLLAADDELDAASSGVRVEDDENRNRLGQAHQEQEATERHANPGPEFVTTRRGPMTATAPLGWTSRDPDEQPV